MPRSPDVSEHWSIETEQTKIGEMTTVKHAKDGVSIVVKEYPNGTGFRLQKPANLPGGYDVIHDAGFGTTDAAMDELERHAEMYDEQGTWNKEVAALIQ